MKRTIIGFMFHDLIQGTLVRDSEVVTENFRPHLGMECTKERGTIDLAQQMEPFMHKNVIITIEDAN